MQRSARSFSFRVASFHLKKLLGAFPTEPLQRLFPSTLPVISPLVSLSTDVQVLQVDALETRRLGAGMVR